MKLAVAVVAQRDGFAHVGIVHVRGMAQDFCFVAVELPEAEDYVVEFHDVVTLQLLGAVALETARCFVSLDPVVVRLGCTNLSFKFTNL